MTAGLLVDAGENEGRVQGHRAEGADGDPENSPFTPGREDRHAAPPAPHGAPELVDGHRQGSSPANEKRHIIPTSAATREILMGSTGKGEGVYNVVVIGAGTAGLVTAAGTAGLGGRVALIERNKMGGDCLNFGCVPSKALISSARLIQRIRNAEKWGLDRQEPRFAFEKIFERMRSCRAKIAPHDSRERFESLGVDVFHGEARFVSSHEVEISDEVLRAKNFVIATGSRATIPNIAGIETVKFFTNETIFDELS